MNRRVRYDLIRIIAALMVIAAHFDTHLPTYLNYTSNYPRPFFTGCGTNLLGGYPAVAIFFMLSGLLSFKSTKQSDFSLKHYYIHRFRRLLVPIYISFFVGVVLKLASGSMYYANNATIVFTIFGMDYYLQDLLGIRTFATIGEWFTGAFLIVEIIWPLFRCRYEKTGKIIVALLFVTEIVSGQLIGEEQFIQYWRSPLVCMTSFMMGVLFADIQSGCTSAKQNSTRLALFALIVAGSVVLHQFGPAVRSVAYQMTALGYIGIVDCIANIADKQLFCRNKKIIHLISDVSQLSYYGYLLQHRVIYLILGLAATCAAEGLQIGLVTVAILLCTVVLLSYVFAYFCSSVERKLLGGA